MNMESNCAAFVALSLPEIVESVFCCFDVDEDGDDWNARHANLADLSKCGRVNKVWYHEAMRHLWRDVTCCLESDSGELNARHKTVFPALRTFEFEACALVKRSTLERFARRLPHLHKLNYSLVRTGLGQRKTPYRLSRQPQWQKEGSDEA
ncbi:hypothetical protein C8R47DRAFT_1324401 [Mycena vitilis]|nr:hypothetical protein C8R47DRAFT_1324401 [Mycena vitilis]